MISYGVIVLAAQAAKIAAQAYAEARGIRLPDYNAPVLPSPLPDAAARHTPPWLSTSPTRWYLASEDAPLEVDYARDIDDTTTFVEALAALEAIRGGQSDGA